MTNYGAFLKRFPPVYEVEIDEGPKGEGTSGAVAMEWVGGKRTVVAAQEEGQDGIRNGGSPFGRPLTF